VPTATSATPQNLPIPVTNQTLILKESQGLTSPSPYAMPLLAGDEVDTTGKAITFARLVHAFRRRYLLATFVGLLLASTVGTLTWMMMPDNYEVNSLMQFSSQSSLVFWRSTSLQEGFDQAGFRATQQQLLTSDIVLSMALLEPDEEKGAIGNLPIFQGVLDKKNRLKSMISVGMPTGSDLMVVKLTGNSPIEQVKLLKAVIRCYLRYQADQDFKPIALQLNKLKKELDESTLNYREVSRKFYAERDIAQDISSPDVQKKMELLRADMHRAENKLIQTDSKIQEIKQQIVVTEYLIKQQEDNQYSDLLLENYFKEFDNFNEAKLRLKLAEQHYFELSSRLTNNRNPQLIQAQRQVQEANKALDELKKELRPAVMAKHQLAGDKNGGGLPLPILKSSLKQSEEEAQRLQEVVATYREEFKTRNQAQTELVERKREMDELNTRIISIERAKDDLEMRLKGMKENPRVVEISSPEVPSAGSGLYRILFSGLAAVLCFMIGAGSIVLVESMKHRVNNLDEITLPGPGMRVLGTIPNLGRLRGKNAETTSAVLAESIDTVRTMILQGKNRNLLHVILVSSAGESEGKTTVATHLAASLARAGRSTLLIDGDLRQPSIHLLFGMSQQAGLCEILRGESEIDDAVQPAQLEGLHLLQAGLCDHVALSMLVKEQGAELFQTLRSKFDYIVIDSGPVLGYADALQLGHYADAAVLSVLRDVSRLPLVYEAREQLEAVGVPILGAVVGRIASAQRTPAAA
jgi:succinoglycan biosynthesis transport protein ExoP